MREGLFIKKNKERWEQVQNGDTGDPDEMARNFVQLLDDLAYAKTFYPRNRVTRYINSLASSIYMRIYQNRKEDSNRLVKFWKYDVPLSIAKHYRVILFSAFVFVLFYALGFFSARYDTGFTREIMGDAYVDMTEKNIEEGNPFGVYQTGTPIIMWLGIMVNNVLFSIISFVKGILFGIFSLTALVKTAMDTGVFHYMFASRGLGVEFIFAVMLHGLLELTSIVITCAAGMVMGTSYLFPGTLRRLEALKIGVKDGIRIVIGLIPVFGIAAFFEGFVTGHYKMPLPLNIFLLLLSASFIAWYFIIYPYRVYQQQKKTQALHVI